MVHIKTKEGASLWIALRASAIGAVPIRSSPARSAIVRATFRMRS